jgi:predicted lipid-binding transport protein (Tim44 family)
MEALLIPLLILLLVGVGVLLASRAMGRRKPAPPRERAAQPTQGSAELARAAAARLDQEQHRRLYALIAQGQAMAAIKLYLEVTGEGLRASRDAVGALAAHPQPYRPQPAPEQPAHDDDEDVPQRFSYRYRAIASKGDVTREVSSNMLNDEIYGRIRTLARSGDAEGAAAALTRHSDISLKQAQEFIALLED